MVHMFMKLRTESKMADSNDGNGTWVGYTVMYNSEMDVKSRFSAFHIAMIKTDDFMCFK